MKVNDMTAFPKDYFSREEYLEGQRLYREKPKFWLEVMSEDENKDRVEKYLAARRIDSMEEFVVVSANPKKPEVSVFRIK